MIVGSILIILGIILFAVGTYLSEDSLIISKNWTNYNNNVWTSQKIDVQSEDIIVVMSKNVYLINSSEISYVNQTDIKSITQQAVSNTSSGLTFMVEKGSYYIITFSTVKPNITYYYGSEPSLIAGGLMILIGIILAIIGIIILIVGLIMKPKVVKSNEIK